MHYKYGEVPSSQIAAEKAYFLSAIFKLLPYREEQYEFLDNYFESILQRLVGFNAVTGFQPEMLTIISLLECARKEEELSKYRKAILDACGLIERIKESDTNV